MTAQITDVFHFNGKNYSLIGKTKGELASPQQFGMNPVRIHTACYRGFYAEYELTQEALYLRKLTLRERDERYIPIGKIHPERDDDYQAVYRGLSEITPFTGKIRLANGFIEDLFIHMGYQKATAYKTILDLSLQDGKIVELIDRSMEIKQKRGAFKKHYETGNFAQTINDAFSLDMNLE